MENLKVLKVRKYSRDSNEKLIEEDKIALLKQLVLEYNAEGDMDIELLIRDEDLSSTIMTGMLKDVKNYFILCGKKEDPFLYEKAGYYGEKIMVEAAKIGLDAHLFTNSFKMNRISEVIPEHVQAISIISVEYRNDIEKRKKSFTKIDNKKIMNTIYKANTVVPDWFIEGILAISFVFSNKRVQPVYLTYLDYEVRIFIKNDNNKMELGIAKACFEMVSGYVFELGNHATLKKDWEEN